MDFFHFENLAAYTRAMDLVEEVYGVLKTFPAEKRYALCDQLRRAVVSVPSNIAEGLSRFSDKEKAHFLEISYGSLMETYCQLSIAKRLGYISEDQFMGMKEQIGAISRPLCGLRDKSLNLPLKPSSEN